jgi:ComF family protein
MHWRGRWRRGYNQSKLLAQVLSKTLGQQSHWKPRVVDNLIASPRKKAQHHMDRQQRQINTLGRYTTNRSFSHQSVLIIDDVVTTGNTLEAVAATLAKAGATRIDAWCLARAPQTHEVTAPSI